MMFSLKFTKLSSMCVVTLHKTYLGYIGPHGVNVKIGAQRNIMSVGFIGLGQMGSRMAKNLLKKYDKLIVYDTSESARARLAEAGAAAASDVRTLSHAECVVSMLPAGEQVVSVYSGADGLLSLLRPGSLVIDCSTVDPNVPKRLASEAKQRDISFLDAPVSGGVGAAEQATLTFMVGGADREPAVERARPLLEAMGRRAIGCGPVGSGQAAKLCNNLLLAGCMAATAEAMNLGVRLSLDPKILASVINSSSGRCWSSDTYNPVPGVMQGVPSSNGYKGGFSSRLMLKDLNLASLAAKRSNSPIPFGKTALGMYKSICDQEMADKDFSVIYQFLQDYSTSKS